MKTKIKPFLDEDFLLENEVASELYHSYASDMPIIDYHNHLSPDQVADNQKYENITQLWLYGDHYKWRAMRTFGIDEKYITGDATDKEKFMKWAETVPYTMRNPLFHWTHMELKAYFGITELLTPENAEEIYEQCNAQLGSDGMSCRDLLQKMKVEMICTTDDPLDDLEHHQRFADQGLDLQMLPAFRPDKAILIQNEGYIDYIKRLSEVSDIGIATFPSLLEALKKRIDYFDERGCKICDHGLSKLYSRTHTDREVDEIFQKRLNGHRINEDEVSIFISGLMHELGKIYAEKGWVMQLHLGALRNNNKRMLRELGPDTGFDSMGDYTQGEDLSGFLDSLDNENKLPKTIIYNLNPRDNELMATMIGNFNDGTVKGKIQYGSAWWFLDQKDGMEKQINALSNMGLLSCFVGMLTDSRSFLSFPRHEYFRRILCNLLGTDVVKGELPHDIEFLGSLVRDICYGNAKRFFEL